MSVNITLLKEIPFFRNLTEEELEDISNITEEIKLQKNSIIFKQGEEADAFYIILDGELIEGNSTVDEAMVTGDSIPVEKYPGDVPGPTVENQ